MGYFYPAASTGLLQSFIFDTLYRYIRYLSRSLEPLFLQAPKRASNLAPPPNARSFSESDSETDEKAILQFKHSLEDALELGEQARSCLLLTTTFPERESFKRVNSIAPLA